MREQMVSRPAPWGWDVKTARAHPSLAHLEEVRVVIDVILHANHCHVRAQGHLARAVAVEVELVLHKVCEVLVHSQEALQSLNTISHKQRTQELNRIDRGKLQVILLNAAGLQLQMNAA